MTAVVTSTAHDFLWFHWNGFEEAQVEPAPDYELYNQSLGANGVILNGKAAFGFPSLMSPSLPPDDTSNSIRARTAIYFVLPDVRIPRGKDFPLHTDTKTANDNSVPAYPYGAAPENKNSVFDRAALMWRNSVADSVAADVPDGDHIGNTNLGASLMFARVPAGFDLSQQTYADMEALNWFNTKNMWAGGDRVQYSANSWHPMVNFTEVGASEIRALMDYPPLVGDDFDDLIYAQGFESGDGIAVRMKVEAGGSKNSVPYQPGRFTYDCGIWSEPQFNTWAEAVEYARGKYAWFNAIDFSIGATLRVDFSQGALLPSTEVRVEGSTLDTFTAPSYNLIVGSDRHSRFPITGALRHFQCSYKPLDTETVESFHDRTIPPHMSRTAFMFSTMEADAHWEDAMGYTRSPKDVVYRLGEGDGDSPFMPIRVAFWQENDLLSDHNDSFYLDNINLYSTGLLWEFSPDEGVNWYTMKDVMNEASSRFVFPSPTTTVRVRCTSKKMGDWVQSFLLQPIVGESVPAVMIGN